MPCQFKLRMYIFLFIPRSFTTSKVKKIKLPISSSYLKFIHSWQYIRTIAPRYYSRTMQKFTCTEIINCHLHICVKSTTWKGSPTFQSVWNMCSVAFLMERDIKYQLILAFMQIEYVVVTWYFNACFTLENDTRERESEKIFF